MCPERERAACPGLRERDSGVSCQDWGVARRAGSGPADEPGRATCACRKVTDLCAVAACRAAAFRRRNRVKPGLGRTPGSQFRKSVVLSRHPVGDVTAASSPQRPLPGQSGNRLDCVGEAASPCARPRGRIAGVCVQPGRIRTRVSPCWETIAPVFQRSRIMRFGRTQQYASNGLIPEHNARSWLWSRNC